MPFARGSVVLRGVTEKSAASRFLLATLLVVAAVLLGWVFIGLTGSDANRQLPESSQVKWKDFPAGTAVAEVDASADGWRDWSPRKERKAGHRDGEGKERWLRVTLRNTGERETRGVLANAACYLDEVSCFTRSGTAGWDEERSGEWVPPGEKALWGRTTAFPVAVEAGGEQVVYLRARDHFSAYVVPEWWPDERAFHSAQVRATLAEGLYFGLVLALLFYNAVLWARLRFPDTGAYLLYLIFFALFMLVSRGDMPLLGVALGSPVMEMALTAALALSGVFLLEFARRLLELPSRSAGAARGLRVAQGVLVFCACVVMTAPWVAAALPVIWVIISAGHIVLLWTSLVAWRRGAREVRYLVLMFGLVFSGLMPSLIVWLEVASIEQSGAVVMAGSAAEMLLLSLAVAYRYSALQREKIEAQQELLLEAERREVMQEAYADELALEVFERTRELREAIADKDRMIAIVAHDLKSPLIAMTLRAKQLAVSTGEVALEHFASETAELGEQLLSLTEDLVSWAKTRDAAANVTRHGITAVVEPMVAIHREAANRRGISLETHLPRELEVLTDLVQAQTLIRNLLSNAIKFANVRVHLSAGEVEGGVRFVVKDDGPGLPAAMAENLAAENADQPIHSGGGLGLRLCREIGHALGIRLHAAPGAGGGTEMSFVLTAAERRAVP